MKHIVIKWMSLKLIELYAFDQFHTFNKNEGTHTIFISWIDYILFYWKLWKMYIQLHVYSFFRLAWWTIRCPHGPTFNCATLNDTI